MRTVEDFQPFVLAYAPFIQEEYVQHAIRETIVAFMRESRIAKDHLTIETQEKVPDYMLEMPDCRRLVKVADVYMSPQHCSGRLNWTKLETGEFGQYEVDLRHGDHPMIVIKDPPKKPHFVRIEYYWTINRDGCDIPEYIYEDYMEAIVAGSLLRLAQLPEQPDLARLIPMYQGRWFDEIQKARMERSGGKAKRIIGAPILSSRRRGSLWR